MITYATFLSGHTTIKHGEHNGKPLVLGFMLLDVRKGEDCEKRYAIHKNGRIKETNWLKPGNYFNKTGLQWHETDHVNIYAEFIGQYVDDIF